MAQNLSPEKIYEYIVQDFEDAWNSLAWNPSARGRGNFMFGLQAMILLEFVSRLCMDDKSRNALKALSNALCKIEPRYFTQLPSICADFAEFDLPYKNSQGDELLWALFDLIRNGQAHQYQQMLVNLSDGVDWQVWLRGAGLGDHLDKLLASDRPQKHLGYQKDPQAGDLLLLVDPGVLFLHLKGAINQAQLLQIGLGFGHLQRGSGSSPTKKKKKSGPYYGFDSSKLEACFKGGGHPVIKIR